jgi:hypothetical protein
MRFLPVTLCTIVAAGLIAGCSGNMSSPSSSVPSAGAQVRHIAGAGFRGVPVMTVPARYLPKRIMPIRGKLANAAEARGIYVASFAGSSVWGFPKNNSGNGPPICTVAEAGSGTNGLGVDNFGYLMAPDAFNGVEVFSGSTMCGTQLGTITDPFGQAADASSVSAATGAIVVGNIFDNSGQPGSVSVCTLASGTCSTNLTNPSMFEVAGVVLARNGDCWADAIDPSDVAVLIYFQGCTGSGVVATGFNNGFYGGVDLDNKGNLVTISLFGPSFTLPSVVNVYSGCNPNCTLLSSSPLTGESIFGHIARQDKRFVTTNLETAAAEVYSYSPTAGLSLLYSFTGGIPCATDECEAAAFSPSSQK